MEEKPRHWYRQSAVLPFRRRPDGVEVLLITSRKKRRWVIPKGIWEPGLTAAESARREAWEEAGVEGRIAAEPLGDYGYDKWGGRCSVVVFPMAVTAEHPDWPESHRDRAWLSVEEAIARVEEPGLKLLLRRLGEPSTGGRQAD